MKLIHDETQAMLAESASRFFATHSPLARMRALRDEGDATGFSRALWRQMAALGWVGMLLPEGDDDEAAGGLAELAVVLEAAGRCLAPEPFLSTSLLAGLALRYGGTPAQRERWLPAIASGEAIGTLALSEPQSRHARTSVRTRAVQDGDGYRVTGEKIQVLDGHAADFLLIPARVAGGDEDRAGITLLLVEAGAPGLKITRQVRVDSRSAALVSLADVTVAADADAVVGTPGAAAELLDPVLDRATVGLAAEMLGAMTQAFEDTVAYLKERKQFGVVIGSFQALKHRAARLFIEISLARAAVSAAARAADVAPARLPALASLAKARCSEALLHVAEEGVQLFGGVGMTDEYDIGFYLKRARAAEQTLGDAAWHRARWAALAGY